MNTSFAPASFDWNETTPCTAFCGDGKLASGSLTEVATAVKAVLDQEDDRPNPLIFDDATGRRIEVDLHGSLRSILHRLPKAPVGYVAIVEEESDDVARKPGRPRLGVQAREVTLLPRHWEWLSEQPGGASAALRRLVEAARRTGAEADRKRRAQEGAHRFMTDMAGNRHGYEEALRSLYAGDEKGFLRRTANWPQDIRDYARGLAREAFAATAAES